MGFVGLGGGILAYLRLKAGQIKNEIATAAVHSMVNGMNEKLASRNEVLQATNTRQAVDAEKATAIKAIADAKLTQPRTPEKDG
jgi:hypothetical protein